MSIGGATGDRILPDPDKAREFARTLYRLFLGGSRNETIRPFGKYDSRRIFQLTCKLETLEFMRNLNSFNWPMAEKKYTLGPQLLCWCHYLLLNESLWTTIQKETIWLLVRRRAHTLVIILDQKDLGLVIVQCSFLYFENVTMKILNYLGHGNNRMQL